MNIDELKLEWSKDTEISDDLGGEAIKCSRLHSKYIDLLINAKLKLTQLEHNMAVHRAKMSKYYRGEMTKDELIENNQNQWQYKTLKSDIPELIEAEPEYQKFQARVEYMKTMIYMLESILGEIKSRNFSIKASIEWAKFRAGM